MVSRMRKPLRVGIRRILDRSRAICLQIGLNRSPGTMKGDDASIEPYVLAFVEVNAEVFSRATAGHDIQTTITIEVS